MNTIRIQPIEKEFSEIINIGLHSLAADIVSHLLSNKKNQIIEIKIVGTSIKVDFHDKTKNEETSNRSNSSR